MEEPGDTKVLYNMAPLQNGSEEACFVKLFILYYIFIVINQKYKLKNLI
jgi:hypothetical protein